MTDSPAQQPQGLTNAQVTGGGGHEPDPEETTPQDTRGKVPLAGSGVDMKSEDLPEPDDD